MKIIEKILAYHKKAVEESNKVLNTVNWLSFFVLVGIFIFLRDTFLYNWLMVIALIGLITHPFVQLKIKKVINDIISTNKILKSKELDWLKLE